VDAQLRNYVSQRAADRCEYCRLPQDAVVATFHVDHVIARQHQDSSSETPDQFALACDRCNLYKGTNLSSIDPASGEVVLLFNPRQDAWSDHFRMEGPLQMGRTPTGRATVRLLQMNAQNRVELRASLLSEGRAFDESE
jgi:hypothetical protein